jgi:hypothetical protein
MGRPRWTKRITADVLLKKRFALAKADSFKANEEYETQDGTLLLDLGRVHKHLKNTIMAATHGQDSTIDGTDALDGQAALDEANNEIVRLRAVVEAIANDPISFDEAHGCSGPAERWRMCQSLARTALAALDKGE